jgi:hypothetical protein
MMEVRGKKKILFEKDVTQVLQGRFFYNDSP